MVTATPRSEAVIAQALTPAQLDAVIGALDFVLAGEWEDTAHGHPRPVYERALERLSNLRGRTVTCLSNQLAIELAERRAVGAEQLLASMMAGGQAIAQALSEAGDSFGLLHAAMFAADQHLRNFGWERPPAATIDFDEEVPF